MRISSSGIYPRVGYKQSVRCENYGHKEENQRKTKGKIKLFNPQRSVLQKYFVTSRLLVDSTAYNNEGRKPPRLYFVWAL